jgi:hypothetical protein
MTFTTRGFSFLMKLFIILWYKTFGDFLQILAKLVEFTLKKKKQICANLFQFHLRNNVNGLMKHVWKKNPS